MKKQGKEFLVADKSGWTNGYVVCPNIFSAVVEYVAQRAWLTTIVIFVLPVVVLTTIVSSIK